MIQIIFPEYSKKWKDSLQMNIETSGNIKLPHNSGNLSIGVNPVANNQSSVAIHQFSRLQGVDLDFGGQMPKENHLSYN